MTSDERWREILAEAHWRALVKRIGAGSTDARDLLECINYERARIRLPALAWSDTLFRAAAYHASDIVKRNFYAHVSPTGESHIDRAVAFGYPHRVGENIAMCNPSVMAVHEAWMTSPGHKAAILNPLFRVVGCAQSELRWVEMFGTEIE